MSVADYYVNYAYCEPPPLWTPNDGPQTDALHSDADVVGYGGAAGGGKTDILLGVGFTRAYDGIIYRRHYTDLQDIVTRGNAITGYAPAYVAGDKRLWEFPDGRRLRLGAVQHEKDLPKFQGRARDFIGIDEAAEFPERWFRYLTGWLRTTRQGQRTRIVLTFNPPQTPEGEWIVHYFAPWLDADHPNPAQPGELRYYIRRGDKDVEVDDATPVEVDGIEVVPQSRTFIPARVQDNPHLKSDYISQLASLPEPLRSQLLKGDFTIRVKDDPWQVIPTAWVLEAQRRGREGNRPDVALRSVGSDPARGGDDNHAIATLYGAWFEIVSHPGTTVPDGASGARQIVEAMAGQRAPINIDVIGYGASVYDHAKALGLQAKPVNNASAAPAHARDKSGKYRFANVRAWSYWQLREALDPDSGEDIALPDSRTLRVDLTSPRYSVIGGKIKIEPKDDIKKRTGRSPDEGDAVVLAWHGIANRVPKWEPIVG